MFKNKKFLRFAWNELIYGSHLTSLAAVSVVFTSAILLNIKITWEFLLIIYLTSQVIYRYNRYKEFKKDSLKISEREKHIEKYFKFIPIIILLFTIIFIIILLFSKKIDVLIIGLSLFIFGLFYSLLFKKITKKIIAFKGLFVSLWWSSMVIFLAVYYSYYFLLPLILIFSFVFLKLFIHSNFFDIKDIENDKSEGLLTLVIVLGKKKMFYFLNILNFFSIMPIIIGVYWEVLPSFSLILTLTLFFTFYYLQKAKSETININYFSQIAISGEKISWSFLAIIGKIYLC